MFEFSLKKKDTKSKARTGIFKTPHGDLHTPELAFVATDAEIRGIPKEMLSKLPVKLTISNTFHTFTKGLIPAIEKAGGLNKYMNYQNTTMTDSGGFQVFSLGFGKVHRVGKVASMFPGELINTSDQSDLSDISGIRSLPTSLISADLSDTNNPLTITENGVKFIYNNQKITLTPELSIDLQQQLGADIIFSFDECTSPLNSYEYTKKAMERTHRWFIRCLKTLQTNQQKSEDIRKNQKPENSDKSDLSDISGIRSLPTSLISADLSEKQQALFAVVQGGMFKDLRHISAKFMAKQPVPGYGIGGALGTTKDEVKEVLDWTIPFLPDNKPRHLLGIGQVKDIFDGVERGVDLFDCVIPTREARHKVLYTKKGKINVRKYRTVHEVIEKGCSCLACRKNLKLDELDKLYKLHDPLAFLYSTTHNIQFFSDLMQEIRESINSNRLNELKNKYFKYY